MKGKIHFETDSREQECAFWICEIIISVSYWMCMGLMMLDRLKNIQLSLHCPFLVSVCLRWLLESWKRIDQITAGMIQVWVGAVRFEILNLHNSYWIWQNYVQNRSCQSLYLFVSTVVKQIAVLIEVRIYHSHQLHKSCVQYPSTNVNSILRHNYCGPSVWISKWQVICWLCVLHSSNRLLKILWKCMGAIHRLFI